MENRNNDLVHLLQADHPKMGFSGTTVTFIFTNLSFLFWADMLGLFGEGSALAIGLIQLGMVISYDGTAIGCCWIICGLFLLAILPACLKMPWVVFLLYALAGVAVLLMGLTRVGMLSDSVDIFSAWLLFAVGVLGFYMVLSGMFGFVGLTLSLGKPLKK